MLPPNLQYCMSIHMESFSLLKFVCKDNFSFYVTLQYYCSVT